MEPETVEFPEYLLDGMRELAEALEGRRIKYALIGGLAAGYRSRPRFTEDVDLLLQVPQLALPGLLDDLRNRGFAFVEAVAIREWTCENMMVMSFHGIRVDWLKPLLPAYQHVLDRARAEDWLGRPVRNRHCGRTPFHEASGFPPARPGRYREPAGRQSGPTGPRSGSDANGRRSQQRTTPRMKWFEEQVARFYLPSSEGAAATRSRIKGPLLFLAGGKPMYGLALKSRSPAFGRRPPASRETSTAL